MSETIKQRAGHCNSCPFLPASLEIHGNHFDPAAPERTVVDYLQNERLHPCHSDPRLCNGYLSFVEQNIDGGIASFSLGRMAIRLGILDPAKIPKLKVFATVEEMLESHEHLMKFTDTISSLNTNNS